MPNTLPFLQLNMHRALVASVELNKALNVNPRICMITEPCTFRNKVCHVPTNFICLPNQALSERPRAAIYIPRHVPHVFLDQLSSRDCAVVLIDTQRGKLLLVSAYLDYNLPVVQPWLRKVMQYSDNKRLPTLLSFDANAHTELYGPDTNQRGEEFEDFIIQNNLLLENRGNKPTFHAFQRGTSSNTHIDFTLSKCLVPLLNWRVHDTEFNGSDHHTLTWEVPVSPSPPPKIRPWLKAKWNVFHDIIKDYDFHIPESFNSLKLDKFLDRWYKVIHGALDMACPMRQAKPTPVESDWYGSHHQHLHNRTKRKYLAYRHTPTARKRKTFVKAKRSYERACRKGKRRAWRIFVESTPNEKNMAVLYRIAQKRDRRSINTLVRQDGSLTEPGTETITELTTAHFPAAQAGTDNVIPNLAKVKTSDLHDRYQDWISTDLVRRSLNMFKPNKAAGPDNLKPIALKHLPDNAVQALTIIYKACIALKHTPKVWRETKVIFLPKPGKDSYDLPKSYRPISLSNFPLKALERLAVWKMDEDLLSRPIHNMQHGFTKGKSTESAISNTADYIEQQLYQGHHCLGLFLDISSAFDSINVDHIRQSLLDHNGNLELVDWYHSYLKQRFLEVSLHGESTRLTTSTGFPQGGVCSARFWLIAFDPAIRIINSEGIVGNGYADDCSALLGGTHTHNMIEKMQSMLDRLVAWGNTCGLRFNPQKTVSVLFTRATRPFPRPVRMDGQLIYHSNSVVYLGVTLDKELKWHIHINNKIKKAKALLMKMANLTYSYWGPRPKLMRWSYTGIVRPVVSYAAMTWAHQTETESMIERLRNLNRTAINTMVKIPRSTPTQGLEIILDILPLHLHIQKVGLAAYIRTFPAPPLQWEGIMTNLTNSISHLKYWELRSRDADLQVGQIDSDSCKILRPTPKFVLDTSSFTDMANCQGEMECNVYTDGSKIADRVGAGVFLYRSDGSTITDKLRLPDHATVYQAELAAIRRAAHILRDLTNLSSIKFYVDSQAALRTLQSDFLTSTLALQTYQALNDIPAPHVVLVWTKAHVGTPGNEKADQLAKDATLLPDICSVPRPHCVTKAAISTFMMSVWQREWENYPQARQTKLYHDKYNPRTSDKLIQWARLKLGRYIRAVTGHCNLLYHLHIIDPNISPICRFCLQANEEFYHLANDCPPFWWERHYITAREPDNDQHWSVEQIIEFAYHPPINAAFVKPLFPIATRTPAQASPPQSDNDDPDDPATLSEMDYQTDSSVMNCTSETDSSTDQDIVVDDPE